MAKELNEQIMVHAWTYETGGGHWPRTNETDGGQELKNRWWP